MCVLGRGNGVGYEWMEWWGLRWTGKLPMLVLGQGADDREGARCSVVAITSCAIRCLAVRGARKAKHEGWGMHSVRLYARFTDTAQGDSRGVSDGDCEVFSGRDATSRGQGET